MFQHEHLLIRITLPHLGDLVVVCLDGLSKLLDPLREAANILQVVGQAVQGPHHTRSLVLSRSSSSRPPGSCCLPASSLHLFNSSLNLSASSLRTSGSTFIDFSSPDIVVLGQHLLDLLWEGAEVGYLVVHQLIPLLQIQQHSPRFSCSSSSFSPSYP